MHLHLKPEDLEKLNLVKSILDRDCRYHYTHSTLCLKIGTNEYLLKNGFKQVFKMTPFEYLTHIRIEKAKELLSSSDYPIKRISYCVGFNNSPSFIKMFKKNTGYSPLAWRKQYGRSYMSA